ncbi:MAG: hypothetical protein RQ862_09860 [Candidatus Caldarchaeales archaeon]|jgi:hypothetical protein|nr:hypothetical protein [Candidatus Caldarchaeales archaeon]
MTESVLQQSQPSSMREEEVQVVSRVKKRGKYLPRELRIKAYDRVIELHQQCRSYN